MPDAPKHLIQKWGSMDSDNFRISSFTTAMKDEHLMNDYLTSIEQFYTSVKIFLQAANKKNVDILPEFSDLSPINTLCHAILPPPSYAEYGQAKACYDSIGQVLKFVNFKNELTKKAPLARKVLICHIGGNKDGWDILHEFFKGRLPYLGATDFDIEATINAIIAKDEMLLADFLGKTQHVQRSIKIAGLLMTLSALLKCFLL